VVTPRELLDKATAIIDRWRYGEAKAHDTLAELDALFPDTRAPAATCPSVAKLRRLLGRPSP